MSINAEAKADVAVPESARNEDILLHDEPNSGSSEDPELEAMKRRVKEMEEEAAKLAMMQDEVEKEMRMAVDLAPSSEESDARSIYVGNVDYGATPEELQAHFQSCGTINRITILCDKWTGQPKGFAYVEFADEAHVANAMALNESLFRNRLIKVSSKRTNVPGFNHRGRSRGGRGGSYRGARGFRGSRSRRAHFSPY